MRSHKEPETKASTGWYVAVIIERFEYYDEDCSDMQRECTAYENVILIRAKDPESAYDKAVAEGKICEGSECVDGKGRKGEFKYVGIAELLPLYDELEDGAEIMWTKHVGVSVQRIQDMATPKPRLGVFRNDQHGTDNGSST